MFYTMRKKNSFLPKAWYWLCMCFIGVSLVSAARASNEDAAVHARITYEIPEGVYVNVGTDQCLQQGTTGSLVFDDGQIVSFEVRQVARNSALLHLARLEEGLPENLRERPVELLFDRQEPSEPESTIVDRASTVVEAKPFVPLLAPVKRIAERSSSKNISHGSVGLRHQFQSGTDNQQGYAITRLDTSGSMDRIQSTAWSFVWSGSARYRTGDAYQNHPDYQVVQPVIYSAKLQYPLDQGGFLRLGRFLPVELPGVGYFDGAQLEIHRDGPWRFGMFGGLKPGLNNLEVSADELTAGGYITLEAGQRRGAYYSGTAGVLGSLFKGEADRLAVLLDQRASYGSKYNLYSTAEVDVGIADTTNSTTQLTRVDVTASARLHRNFTLRAGFDHWQRPDTLAQRALLVIVDDRLFDNGYWRYWVGGRHKLPWNLRLNEEVAMTVSDAGNNAMRWRFGLSRTGLFSWSNASLRASLYNLEAQGADGYGSVISAYLPWWNGKLVIRPASGMRWLDTEAETDGLSLTYYSIYADALLTKTWTLSGGLMTTRGDAADSTVFDLGVRYRW